LDYKDIFSSVVQANSLRILLSIAASEDMVICTFDIKSAFLYGNLNDEIYMRLPEDFNVSGKICKLKKALYGLKQAPQLWFKRLTDFLKNEKLKLLMTDQCVFKSTSGYKLFIAIHVDDGIVIGENIQQIKFLMSKLQKQFQTTVNFEPKNYLGMQISKNQNGISISQPRYAEQVIIRYNMQTAKPTSTPISLQNSSPADTGTLQTNFPYQEAVGSLLYLSCKTRPDISYAVNFLSRYTQEPKQQDVVNVKRTLRYLKGTIEEGIHYSNRGNNTLEVYCDSDHAGDQQSRKSTTGYLLFYAGGPIAWSSRKQSIVAQSSTEAEYIAAAQCCKEMKYVKCIIEELLSRKIDVNLYIDNTSCIRMIEANQLTRKCIYIDVKYHFVKEEFKKGWFSIKHCPTDQNVADLLTKPLLPVKYERLKNAITSDLKCV